MVLITQGFPFIDVENLSHIARSMSPDEPVAPWLFNYLSLIGLLEPFLSWLHDIKFSKRWKLIRALGAGAITIEMGQSQQGKT